MRLLLMVLVASAIVTLYNEHLVRREAMLATAGAKAAGGVTSDPPVTRHEQSEPVPGKPVPLGEIEPPGEDVGGISLDASPAEDAAMGEPASPEESETKEKAPPEKAAEKSMPPVLDAEATSEQAQGKAEEASKPESAPEREEPDLLGSMESMDELLDYAFAQQSEGNDAGAIAAYRLALERYAEDGYAPFIAIDLVNVYKNRADYDAAIQTLEEALDLSSVSGNDGTYREFQKNLSYLRIVREVLASRDAMDTPFPEISQEFMGEIEAEFQSQQVRPLG